VFEQAISVVYFYIDIPVIFQVSRRYLMEAMKYFLALLIFASVSTVSCRKMDVKEKHSGESKPMTELKVDANFNWETTRCIDVRLTGTSAGVVYIRPLEGDYYFCKGMLSSGADFATKITLPSYVKEVKLTFKGLVRIVSVNDNRLEYNFK
jgi:hypothetical protein